jgi:hypothetical protein
MQQTLYDSIHTQEYAKKDKRRLYIKRFFVNVIVLTILGLSLWAIQTAVVKFSSDTGTLQGWL